MMEATCVVLCRVGAKEMQVRLVARGCETVLGDAASDAELFLTSEFLTR